MSNCARLFTAYPEVRDLAQANPRPGGVRQQPAQLRLRVRSISQIARRPQVGVQVAAMPARESLLEQRGHARHRLLDPPSAARQATRQVEPVGQARKSIPRPELSPSSYRR